MAGGFGFGPEDFDSVLRDVSEGLRDAVGRLFANEPSGSQTTGDTGDGAWAIYTVDDDGSARVEEVHATELDALRANKDNTNPRRKVRFLPYGIAASVLDATEEG